MGPIGTVRRSFLSAGYTRGKVEMQLKNIKRVGNDKETLTGLLTVKHGSDQVTESATVKWSSSDEGFKVVSSGVSTIIDDQDSISVVLDMSDLGLEKTLNLKLDESVNLSSSTTATDELPGGNDASESQLDGEGNPPDIKGTYEGSSFYVGNVYGVTIPLGQNKEVKGKMIFITDGRFVETTLIPDDSSSEIGFNSLPGVWRKRTNSLGDVHWDLEFADTMTFHGSSIAAIGEAGWMTKGGGRWTITPTLIEKGIVVEYDAIYVDDGYNQANNQKPTASYGSWRRISPDVTIINDGSATEPQDEPPGVDEDVAQPDTSTVTRAPFFLTTVDTEALDTLSGRYNANEFIFSTAVADSEQEALCGGTITINGVGPVVATFSFKSVRYTEGDLYEEQLQIMTSVGSLVANALYVDYGVGFISTAEKAHFLVHTSYGELRDTKGYLIQIIFDNTDASLPRTIALVPAFGASKVNANLLPTESDLE